MSSNQIPSEVDVIVEIPRVSLLSGHVNELFTGVAISPPPLREYREQKCQFFTGQESLKRIFNHTAFDFLPFLLS